MTRSMRMLLATLVAIALVVGFAPRSAEAATAQRAPATSPSTGCQAEYDSFLTSAVKYNDSTKKVQRDNKRVKLAKAKVAKSKNAKQRKRAVRSLKVAKRARGKHTTQQKQAKQRAIVRYYAWQDCETAASGEPVGTSPIQEVCDAGVPQAVCDVFETLPLPDPGSTGDSPIQPLCDAGLPQELCDAATLPGVGGDSPLQPLCDLGLPQNICDSSVPTVPIDPTLPPVPPLPPLPTDPTLPPLPTDPPLPPAPPVLEPLCTLLPLLCP